MNQLALNVVVDLVIIVHPVQVEDFFKKISVFYSVIKDISEIKVVISVDNVIVYVRLVMAYSLQTA